MHSQLTMDNVFKIVRFLGCIADSQYRTTYVDAAYCYQPSCMVCWSVAVVSPAEMAEAIKMPLGLQTRVSPRICVLDGGPDPPWEGAVLGERVSHCNVTHLVWPQQPENPPGRPRAQRISP